MLYHKTYNISLCCSKRHVPWLTKSIQRICKRKQHLHMKAKEGKSDQAWVRYNACKRHANKELRIIRGRFIDGIIIIECDTKLFWKYIKSTHSDFPGVAPLKKTILSSLTFPTRLIYCGNRSSLFLLMTTCRLSWNYRALLILIYLPYI